MATSYPFISRSLPRVIETPGNDAVPIKTTGITEGVMAYLISTPGLDLEDLLPEDKPEAADGDNTVSNEYFTAASANDFLRLGNSGNPGNLFYPL